MNFTIKQEKKNFTIKYAGAPGLPGSNGDSAYLVWLSQGNSGTEQDFLDSLKGQDGINGTDGTTDYNNLDNKPNLDNFLVATDVQAGNNITLAVVGKTVTISSIGGGGGSSPSLDSNYNFIVGSGYVTTGLGNILIGYNCGQQVIDQSGNIAIGFQTLKNYPVNNCTAIGYFSSANLTGSFNTSVGRESLGGSSSGNFNTAIGVTALYNTNYSNCTGIGNYAQVTGDNQVQLGNSSTTTYVFGTVQNRSDRRDKTDIKECSLGLDFILSLNPVDYKWNMREDYIEKISEEYEEEELNEKNEKVLVKKLRINYINHKNDGSKTRKRYHHGFIAQDFIDKNFGGFQDHSKSGGQEVMTIGYDEFIAPMVKAMQEQQLIIEQLKNDILLLKSSLK